jgi:hypothetical protein
LLEVELGVDAGALGADSLELDSDLFSDLVSEAGVSFLESAPESEDGAELLLA